MARHFAKNSRRAIASLDPPYGKLIGPESVRRFVEYETMFRIE